MPDIGDTRMNTKTGVLGFPMKTPSGRGGGFTDSVHAESEMSKKVKDLEEKLSLLSTALTIAQGQIADLTTRINAIEG